MRACILRIQIKLKQSNNIPMHNYIAFHAGHDVIWLVLVALARRPHSPLELASLLIPDIFYCIDHIAKRCQRCLWF